MKKKIASVVIAMAATMALFVPVQAQASNSYSVVNPDAENYDATGTYAQIQGISWNYGENGINIQAPYVSSDTNPQFKWEAYNLNTQEWMTIQDWSESNQAEWHGEVGQNYWLHCTIRSVDGTVSSSYTMCFHYTATEVCITGTYSGMQGMDLLLGATTSDSNANIKFTTYYMGAGWNKLQEFSYCGNWVTAVATADPIRVVYEVYAPDGTLSDVIMYEFTLADYPLALN